MQPNSSYQVFLLQLLSASKCCQSHFFTLQPLWDWEHSITFRKNPDQGFVISNYNANQNEAVDDFLRCMKINRLSKISITSYDQGYSRNQLSHHSKAHDGKNFNSLAKIVPRFRPHATSAEVKTARNMINRSNNLLGI